MIRPTTFGLFLLGLACSSAPPPADPTALTAPVAQNITITQVTLLQALEVPIMNGGNPATTDIPIIALRDSILRVWVTPGNGWLPHPVTARAKIVTTTPFGTTAQVFSTVATMNGISQETDLTSTIQIPIPGVSLEKGSSITVVLNDTTGDDPSVPQSYARWPMDGSLADLGVQDGGDKVRVMIVPVQYAADGSQRLPDTSDAQMEVYRERFYQLYPTAEVDMMVRSQPWQWDQAITGTGSGIGNLLMALFTLRGSDNPDPDVYYYAAFEPTPDFNSYCGGGCITGLSTIGAPVSVGIGYTGPETAQTAVHEVGHAHGRYHAPCCGAGSPDPAYPYAGGFIGVWGYDTFNKVMIDPTMYTDMMGYCSPSWISDYHYDLIFTRVRTDNLYFDDWVNNGGTRDALPRFATAPVLETGDVHVTPTFTREPWVVQGQPRETVWDGGATTSYYFPFDHLPGGVLYVPEGVPTAARVRGLRASEPETIIRR